MRYVRGTSKIWLFAGLFTLLMTSCQLALRTVRDQAAQTSTSTPTATPTPVPEVFAKAFYLGDGNTNDLAVYAINQTDGTIGSTPISTIASTRSSLNLFSPN